MNKIDLKLLNNLKNWLLLLSLVLLSACNMTTPNFDFTEVRVGNSQKAGLIDGSGLVSGVLEVSNRVKSLNAFKNYNPQKAIEFIYATKNEDELPKNKGKFREVIVPTISTMLYIIIAIYLYVLGWSRISAGTEMGGIGILMILTAVNVIVFILTLLVNILITIYRGNNTLSYVVLLISLLVLLILDCVIVN